MLIILMIPDLMLSHHTLQQQELPTNHFPGETKRLTACSELNLWNLSRELPFNLVCSTDKFTELSETCAGDVNFKLLPKSHERRFL